MEIAEGKKREFLAVFVLLMAGLGLVLAMTISGDEKNGMALCMEYFLEQFLYEDVVKEELLSYVLFHRIFLLFLGALNGIGLLRTHTKAWLIGFLVFLVSYGWGILILRYHIKAVVLLFGMVTPQWYFYIISLLATEKMKKAFEMSECRKTLIYCGFFVGWFALGMLLEITINPVWMKFLIDLI